MEAVSFICFLTLFNGFWITTIQNIQHNNCNSKLVCTNRSPFERIYQKDGISFREEYSKDGSRAEMSVMLPNGVMVELTGDNVDMDGLRGALAALDVKGLSTLKREE